MRYIRTKDEIMTQERYESIHIAIDEHNNKPSSFVKLVLIKPSIIAQADTIEELCDCYVRKFIKKSKGMKPMILSGKNDRTLILNEHEDYGAVWVIGKSGEPILKSVAKINNKGDLELL